MKRTIVLAACVLVAAVSLSSSAQDMAVTAGEQAKVVLDNDKVRVIQLDIAPGGKTGMHSHGDSLVVFLTGGDATQTGTDGTKTERHTEAGEVMWSEPVTHDTENTGKEAVKVLVVELKEPAK
jgi:quercetin dioxygenase-like cupin family protein